MGVVVERIRAEQWRDLRTVRLRALADTPDAFLRTLVEEEAYPEEEWQRRASERASGDDGVTFLAEVDGEPAGIVGGHRRPEDPSTVELVAMWSAPEHRGGGVGRALVDAVVGWAAAAGAVRVVLWVVRGNDGARAFYERVGFRMTDEIIPLPGDPCREEQRMVLDLG
jgi:GNAT superfamily N-acetyltransferase